MRADFNHASPPHGAAGATGFVNVKQILRGALHPMAAVLALQFEVEDSEEQAVVSGVKVPKTLLEELLLEPNNKVVF